MSDPSAQPSSSTSVHSSSSSSLSSPPPSLPGSDVLRHIVDVHCHPTDAPSISPESMRKLGITVCAMSSMQSDQTKVKELALAYPEKVVPCFGYHPWFSHLIYLTRPSEEGEGNSEPPSKVQHYRDLFFPKNSKPISKDESDEREVEFRALLSLLPNPRPLSSILTELRSHLSSFPNAMLGEVGLDRVFRVPLDYFASPRQLTSFTIPLNHQLAILEAQMEVAVELERNVSVHSVKSQLMTVELLKRMKEKHSEKWNKISVDMHSCGLSPQTWRDIERRHENVFLSLSTVINHNHGSLQALIAECSPGRILAESDYNDIDMCTSQTWDMIQLIAEVKGWSIETEWNEEDEADEAKWGVVRRLEKNWIKFKNGYHPTRRAKKKKTKRPEYVSEDEKD
ncbi:hypothetical protein CPB84DRAFT_1355249 [Gymnopilus junonius]|uniref:TatD DNase family Scn1 n=1 Tax=Gymnopilus junonius TaxID=109634 RepID=A0A9P5NV12_GYMJU|nr:hypothetical protein CPB84DRAFT_1355249 [Gymnopilus junonius]